MAPRRLLGLALLALAAPAPAAEPRTAPVAAEAGTAPVAPQPRPSPLAAFGEERFPPLYREAVQAWVDGAAAYRRGDHRRAAAALDALWRRHPAGSTAWRRLGADTVHLHRVADFGTPPVYSALRMLDECVRWRLTAGPAAPRQVVQLTVVLVGESAGRAPADQGELEGGLGTPVVHALDPAYAGEGAARVLEEGSWLFDEYLLAITRGELGLRRVVVRLPRHRVALELAPGKVKLSRPETDRIFAAVPPEVARASDWWHLVYPSHVPTAPVFEGVRFVTGGLRAGPRGSGAPCFLSEDLKYLRAPNQDGRRVLTPLERQVALPQWLQHEFFHHLLGLYRDEALEARPHQWFDRAGWPADFEGFGEADYFAEAVHKRLWRHGGPSIAARLRRPVGAAGRAPVDLSPVE